METSALFTFPPDEDDEKNVYATRPPLLPAAVQSVAVAQMTFNRVCSIPSFPPSPSLVWPFDREESISQERHVSKVRESDPPLLSLQKGVRARRTVWTERGRQAGSDRARSPRREKGGSEGDLI